MTPDQEKRLLATLERIADALDRAYPIPATRKGRLHPGVAEYHYEDKQTLELRRLQKNGEDETPADR